MGNNIEKQKTLQKKLHSIVFHMKYTDYYNMKTPIYFQDAMPFNMIDDFKLTFDENNKDQRFVFIQPNTRKNLVCIVVNPDRYIEYIHQQAKRIINQHYYDNGNTKELNKSFIVLPLFWQLFLNKDKMIEPLTFRTYRSFFFYRPQGVKIKFVNISHIYGT